MTGATRLHRRRRRSRQLVAAVAAIGAMFASVLTASAPAAAWLQSDLEHRCGRYPSGGDFAVVIDSSVPDKYRKALTDAAAAWNTWSGSTQITLLPVSKRADVPDNHYVITTEMYDRIPSSSSAYASAASTCDRDDAPTGGIIKISTANSDRLTTDAIFGTFVHEYAHLFGVWHNDGDFCATSMRPTANNDTVCRGDSGLGPYPDDVAAVLALWRPTATAGFPADARISPASDPTRQLTASYASTSSTWNPLSFLQREDSSGYADWTFVPATSNDGWGWVVNSETGLCLTSYTGWVLTSTYMDYCVRDTSLWSIRQASDGDIQLLNKDKKTCLAPMQQGFYAQLADCTDLNKTRLHVRKVTTTRSKRSVDGTHLGASLVNLESKQCLTAPTFDPLKARNVVTLGTCTDKPNQKWEFTRVGEGDGYLLQFIDDSAIHPSSPQLSSPGYCAEDNLGVLELRNCTGSVLQVWSFGGDGKVRNIATAHCVDPKKSALSPGSSQNPTAVEVTYCGNDPYLVWSAPELLLQQRSVSLSVVPELGRDRYFDATGTTLAKVAQPPGESEYTTVMGGGLTKDVRDGSAGFVWTNVDGSTAGLLASADPAGFSCMWARGEGERTLFDPECDGTDPRFRWTIDLFNPRSPGAFDGTVVFRNGVSPRSWCLEPADGTNDMRTSWVKPLVGTSFNCDTRIPLRWRVFPNYR